MPLAATYWEQGQLASALESTLRGLQLVPTLPEKYTGLWSPEARCFLAAVLQQSCVRMLLHRVHRRKLTQPVQLMTPSGELMVLQRALQLLQEQGVRIQDETWHFANHETIGG